LYPCAVLRACYSSDINELIHIVVQFIGKRVRVHFFGPPCVDVVKRRNSFYIRLRLSTMTDVEAAGCAPPSVPIVSNVFVFLIVG